MCLGVPAQIAAILDGEMARVDVSGNQIDISIQLTPDAKIGDYVLIHAGFAMDIIDVSIAEETRKLLKEVQALVVKRG